MKIIFVFSLIVALSYGVLVPRSEWPKNTRVTPELQQQLEESFGADARNPDIYLDVPELIEKYGYPVEVHDITTKDGYILQVHRIPYGRNSPPSEGKRVAWLQHGLLCSSADWIMSPTDKALAYRLADEGYDVWMGNSRGNYYSRRHISHEPKDKEFWFWSWHEMGHKDLPDVIDYALEVTKQEKLFYYGHSMGTTQFFVSMQENPEYNDKIFLMSALAPVAFMENLVSPLRLIAPFANQVEWLLNMMGLYEFLPSTALMEFLGATICKENSPIQGVCASVVFLICGFDSEQLNRTMLPVILGHTPAGASTHTLVHYAQEMTSGYFRQFDHGKNNQDYYGAPNPPNYDLSKITAPVALYWSTNDWLAAQSDVFRLADQLPNLVRKYKVPLPKFNHLDFLWAIDINPLLYNTAIDFMTKF